jgi:hypothetical protein
MQNANNRMYPNEVGLFNQIALFSVAGLSLSMAMAATFGNFQILFPWF